VGWKKNVNAHGWKKIQDSIWMKKLYVGQYHVKKRISLVSSCCTLEIELYQAPEEIR
jgi:hypothetical protein